MLRVHFPGKLNQGVSMKRVISWRDGLVPFQFWLRCCGSRLLVAFSSNSTAVLRNEGESTTIATTNRISRTLYRQLLRGCQRYGSLPLSSIIGPIHLQPPEIDPHRLQKVLACKSSPTNDKVLNRVGALLQSLGRPPMVRENEVVFMAHHTLDLRKIVQVAFRLNVVGQVKEQQSAAFEAVRDLNELVAKLETMENERSSHLDRDGVHFRIGQVVRHGEQRWRGVICDWFRPYENLSSSKDDNIPPRKSSLTVKDYSTSFESAGKKRSVFYHVILDDGDVLSRAPPHLIRASQNDLQAVEDDHLMRIRSDLLDDKFVRYDSTRKLFIPSEHFRYMYPQDQPDTPVTATLSHDVQQLCDDIVDGVRDFAIRLQRCILDETSCPAERRLFILANLQSRLDLLIAGDVFSLSEMMTEGNNSPFTVASCHIRELHAIHLEILDVNHKRFISKRSKDRIQFKIGDVVLHRVFGFRGVIVAWDPKPVVNVREWDGLKHIKDPQEQPFYQVAPDVNDCLKVFGGPRSLRYVCQENLEVCPPDMLDSIQVDLDPEWIRKSSGSYQPPSSVVYRQGGDMHDDGITERCLLRMQDEYNSWHLNSQLTHTEDTVVEKLSMNRIQKLLQHVDKQSDALVLQEMIKEMRKAHPQRDLRWRLESAMVLLVAGQVQRALEAFRDIVKEDPQYAEGWSKLATCQFLFGKFNDSLESTRKVLNLDNWHAQALHGIGIIYFEQGKYHEAVEAFRKRMTIDPWSPVSSKLSLALDKINRDEESY